MLSQKSYVHFLLNTKSVKLNNYTRLSNPPAPPKTCLLENQLQNNGVYVFILDLLKRVY